MKAGYVMGNRNGRSRWFHRLVMEDFLGRDLLPNEHIHHLNGDKKDNRIENLQMVSQGEHNRIHNYKGFKPCGLDYCTLSHYARGMCYTHYQRFMRRLRKVKVLV